MLIKMKIDLVEYQQVIKLFKEYINYFKYVIDIVFEYCYLCFMESKQAFKLNKVNNMYEIYHYDENDQLFQVLNVNSNANLNLYKEIQVSQGESIFIYCTVTGELLESFNK